MFLITMTTCRRENDYDFLYETFEHLSDSDIFSEKYYGNCEFHLFESRAGDSPDLSKLHPSVVLHQPDVDLAGFDNTKHAILYARDNIKPTQQYWLHFQDDIEVSYTFMERVHRRIKKYQNRYLAFSFYTPYDEIKTRYGLGKDMWNYPNKAFYGLLAVAIHKHLLQELSVFYEEITRKNPETGIRRCTCDDLALQQFMIDKKLNFCACVPNIVQHIGNISAYGHKPVQCRGFVK